MRLKSATLTFALLFSVGSLWGQAPDASTLESYIRLHYTKQEHQIPMRDGVKLFTAVYLPRDTTRKYPLLMKRTPYSVAPYGDAAVCPNEDRNRNGVLDASDDTNNDGQLWPRKPDVIIRLLQNKTGIDGTAILQIEYAQDHGSWVDALITVSASGVSGSEGRASYFVAPVPVDNAALINATTGPAFVVSPYGRSTDCRNPN